MSFFKELKDDLSQAVNELLPEDELQDGISDDEMVDTLGETEQMAQEESLEDGNVEKELFNDFSIDGETDINDSILDQAIDADKTGEEEEEVRFNELPAEEIVEAEEQPEEEKAEQEVILTAEEDNINRKDIGDENKVEMENKEESVLEKEDNVTVITKGTIIDGSISSDGSLEVKGTILGDIKCEGKLSIIGKVKGNSTASEIYVNTARLEGGINSGGSVKVGVGTVVIGDVVGTSGVIAGAVKGQVDINGPVIVDSTAVVKGNITAKSVQINNGAVIDGYCSMSHSEVDIDNFFDGEE